MGIEYEKELYSRMESLRSELEAEYNRNSSLAAELKALRRDVTMTAAWERRALDAEASLLKAVEVIRAARRHNDNPRFYNAAIEDVTAAFLATMEKKDG